MKLTEQYTAQCCDKEWVQDTEWSALDKLLNHIMHVHPELYAKLKQRGRILARSNNGCGYWDSDSENGWDKAQPTYRRAWIENALKERLRR